MSSVFAFVVFSVLLLNPCMPGKNNSSLPQLCLQLWPRFHLSRRAAFNRPFQKQTEPKHTKRHSPGKLTDFHQHKRLIMKCCIPITKPLVLHYATFQQWTVLTLNKRKGNSVVLHHVRSSDVFLLWKAMS